MDWVILPGKQRENYLHLAEVLSKPRNVSQFQTMTSELSVFNGMGDHSVSTRDVTVLEKEDVLAAGLCTGTP